MAKRRKTSQKARAVIKKLRENPATTLSYAKQGGTGVISFAVSAFVSHQSSKIASRLLGTTRGNLVGLGTSLLTLGIAWWATQDRLEKYRVAILSGIGATVVLRLVHLVLPTATLSPRISQPAPQGDTKQWESVHTVEPEDVLGDDDLDLEPGWKF